MTKAKRFTSMEVVELTGCSYRQLDHWCRRGHIPGQEGVVGSGHRRSFTPTQVTRVEVLLRASQLVNTRLGDAVELLEA